MRLSSKNWRNLLSIIIIVLIGIFLIKKMDYKESYHDLTLTYNYDPINVDYINLHLFNIKANTDIVTLPENMHAISIIDNEVYAYKGGNFGNPDYLIKNLIPLIAKYIYPHLHNKNFYFLFNTSDGHGERLNLYDIKEVSYYRAKQNEFKGKQEIQLNSNKEFPLFHEKKYVFSNCKLIKDKYSICIPDAFYICSKGYVELIREMENIRNNILWSEKKNIAIWRGSKGCGTKYNFKKYITELNQREYFISIFKKGILNNINYSEQRATREEICKYKYILDFDGWSNTWDATFWKLISGSVLFKVEGVWEQWYYPKLIPWIHYVPIKDDLSDLNEVLNWCIANDDKCKQIANNAYIFVNTELSFKKSCDYMIEQFNLYT